MSVEDDIGRIFVTPPHTKERENAIREAVGFAVGTFDGVPYIDSHGLRRPAMETEARLFAALYVAPRNLGGGSGVAQRGPGADELGLGWPRVPGGEPA